MPYTIQLCYRIQYNLSKKNFVGVSCIQPPEYAGGHKQYGHHCQAVGCGEWGGSGHTDCEIPFPQTLSHCFSCSSYPGVVTHIHSLMMIH